MKALRLTFGIAAATAIAISLCQIYWVYNNYRVSKTNFVRTARYALEKSIDAYLLSQDTLPSSLHYKEPSLTVFKRTIPDQDPLAFDTPKSIRRFHAEFMTVSVDSLHLPAVQALIARLQYQQLHLPLNIDTLNKFFRKELAVNGISDPFRLQLQKDRRLIRPEEIAAVIDFYRSPIWVMAIPLRPSEYINRRNLLPALVSTLLVLFSAASLFYLWGVIRRQKKLDGMKSDFINNITHELRTPLAILKSSNEALASFGAADEPESLKRYLQINDTVLDKLDSAVERILSFGKAEKEIPNYDAVDLSSLIDQLVTRFRLDTSGRITIIYEGPTAVQTDPFIIDAILSNLLDNAIKYSAEEAAILLKFIAGEQDWEIQVSDKGIGIGRAQLPFIFDPFYRVQTGYLHEVKGYGLGLAYVKQLVTILNGKIKVESKPGEGTSFSIKFPA
ncbi:MAG TPA: HAMP domain-containing sensor histidine kinase [Puia sp.]